MSIHSTTIQVDDSFESAGVRVVGVSEHDRTEAFVSPRDRTGVLFQLRAYHEGYAARHGGCESACVDGVRLGGGE